MEIEAEFKDNDLNGKVKKFDENGELKFEGEYRNGNIWNGEVNEENFQGEYLNGKRWNGKGREFEKIQTDPTSFAFLPVFEGEYINGKRWNGKGREFEKIQTGPSIFTLLLAFEGEYINGKKEEKDKFMIWSLTNL